MSNLPGSTYDVAYMSDLGMHAKQERVESLNYSNYTVLTHVYLSGPRVYGRKGRVYEQYTRQDHPIGNTENILQYYKSTYTLSIICTTNIYIN